MSKCDFFLKYAGSFYSQPPDLARPLRFDLRLPSIPVGSLSSSKCDWRVSGESLDLGGVAQRLDSLKARFAGGRLGLASSKCDWRISVGGGTFAGIRRPDVLTSFAASKCDYTLDMEVAFPRGPGLRIAGAGSSKCDFRIRDVLTRRPGSESWTPSGPEKTK